MLYLEIYSYLHHPGSYVYKDNALNINGKILCDDDIPQHWIKDELTGEYDVYNFAIWGRGVKCIHVESSTNHFKIDTSISLFSLLDYIKLHIDETRELFDRWRAQRIKNDYFLIICVDSVSSDRLVNYFEIIKNWISTNGELVSCDIFEIPSASTSSCDEVYSLDIGLNDLKRIENESNNLLNYWSTEWPEFEGTGSDFATIMGYASGIALLLNFIGVATPQQRYYLKERRKIKKCRNKIYNIFKIRGHLIDPPIDQHIFDKDQNRLYLFEEELNGKTVNKYEVILKPKKAKGHKSILYIIRKK